MTREAASPWHELVHLTTYHGALLPEGAEFHTYKAPGVLTARLNMRNRDKRMA